MNAVKTFKCKLYRADKNSKLHRQINCAGLTYNHCVALHNRYYKLFGKYLKKGKLQKHLTELHLGDFYIFIVTDAKDFEEETRTGKSVCFDFGLKTFLTASDGKSIENPLFFVRKAKLIAKASKNLSHKAFCSNNHRKAKLNLARLHKKLANQRRDFHFKLSRKLCLEYEKICIEDLNLEAMQILCGKKISDLLLVTL